MLVSKIAIIYIDIYAHTHIDIHNMNGEDK